MAVPRNDVFASRPDAFQLFGLLVNPSYSQRGSLSSMVTLGTLVCATPEFSIDPVVYQANFVLE